MPDTKNDKRSRKRKKSNGNPGNPGTKPRKKSGSSMFQNIADFASKNALQQDVSNDNFPQRVQGGVIELAPAADRKCVV